MNYPHDIPPHICDKFAELTLQVRALGIKKYSARAILHRLRWHYQIDRGDIHFKVNNNYSARLSRWFMKNHFGMHGFFETREGAATKHNMHGYHPRNDI